MRVDLGAANPETRTNQGISFEVDGEFTRFQVLAALRHFRKISPKNVHIRLVDGNEVTELT